MRRGVVLFVLVACAAAAPSASGAEFGIVPGSVRFALLDAEGGPETRAGSHPALTQIDFAFEVEGTGTTPRDLVIELPPGLAGSAAAVPDCPRAVHEAGEPCPDESQIGVARLGFSGLGEIELPLFQVEPAPGQLMGLSSLPGLGSEFEMKMRPEDSGITIASHDLPEQPLTTGHLELWGVPADRQQGTAIPRRAFLTAPTRCGPLGLTIRVRSWQEGAPWLSASAESAPLSGCESLAFEPRLEMQLSNPRADSPSGLRMDLTLAENHDPDGQASAQLSEARFEMPEGVSISPGAAGEGLVTCSDAQFGLGVDNEVRCPPESRMGAVEVSSSSTREPLMGSVYMGEERPGEPFRMFVVAGGGGIVTKFAGAMEIDPVTGRLSTTVKDMPEVPIERLSMDIGTDSVQLLATPLECGTFQGGARLVPHGGGPAAFPVASISVGAAPDGSACPPSTPFSPTLTATASRRAAGKPTVVSMILRRRAGERLPRRFAVTMPRGLSTAMAGIELCSETAAAAGSCPPGGRIGSALFEVGVGDALVAQPGDLFLGPPYRGAPFSMVMTFRSRAGSFDLGATSFRSALRIDPRSGRAKVESDPLPTLVGGIPIRLRTIAMTLDRPGMVRNPTSCARTAFEAKFEAGDGATATATSGLRSTGCARLGFRPRFHVALSGRAQMHEGGRPGLTVGARLRRGDAALRRLSFSLPRALKFRLAGIEEICSRRDARGGLCGPGSRVGAAEVRTPIFDEPLKGSVRVVQPAGKGQPDLWISVAGAGVEMSMRGRTAIRRGRLVSRLAGMPDMPLSSFSMRLRGGAAGILGLKASPCERGKAGPRLATPIAVKAQNGAVRKLRLRAKAPCGAPG